MASFIPNRGFARELKAERSYVEGMAAAAAPAAQNARDIAPVDEGDYRDGIRVTIDGDEVRIDAMDWKSGFIEYGTEDTPVFAPLRRGAEAAGLKFKADR